MTVDVFLARAKATKVEESLVRRTAKLFDRAGGSSIVARDDLVALKLSFSEYGNTALLRPQYVRSIVDRVKEAGAKPFLTDSNTLYRQGRYNSVDHIETAVKNGFSYATVNAPVIIADGLTGRSYTEVEIGLRHFKKAKIGSEVVNADALISLAHVHGHGEMGFAATMKNVGMGLGSRGGKQAMHCQESPAKVELAKCTACGRCILRCPVEAISARPDSRAEVDAGLCIRCGECTITCPVSAIVIRWGGGQSRAMTERVVEYVHAVLKAKRGKVLFYNFLVDVTPGCLCSRASDRPFIGDVGVLACTDPVAADQAAYDLVNEQEGIKNSALRKAFRRGQDKYRDLYPEIDSRHYLKYAEEIGLGSRKHRIIEV